MTCKHMGNVFLMAAFEILVFTTGGFSRPFNVFI